MDGMFYHDQKQKEQAQLKLQIDSEQYFQKVEGQDLLSEQYSYFEKLHFVFGLFRLIYF